MTFDANDPTLCGLRRLTVLEPDPVRTGRVRQRCRVALAARPPQAEPPEGSRRSAAVVLDSRLLCGLSIGYLFAMIGDLLRLYLRR